MSHFNKRVGKFIDKEKAEKHIENWKKLGVKTNSSFFGSEIIKKQLEKPGAVGLRIYYAMDDDGNMQPIIYAADSQGASIRTTDGKDENPSDGGANFSNPSPPY